MVWLDRAGREIGAVAEPADYGRLRLSPDGRRLAVEVWRSGAADFWLYDLSRTQATRFTFDTRYDRNPMWSSDGSAILFGSRNNDVTDFYLKSVIGSGAERVIASTRALGVATDWSPDGRFVLMQRFGVESTTAWDLSVFSIADSKLTTFYSTPFTDSSGAFSPDGRWVAYNSNESGRFEIYVLAFPGAGRRWQVSTDGGEAPRWRHDGRELYYIAPGGRMMAAPIERGDAFEAGTPRFLFNTQIKRYPGTLYDASPDGQKFLVNTSLEDPALPITVVLDWPATIKR